VAVGQVLFKVLDFSPISVISLLLHIHLHIQATLYPLPMSFHHCSTFIFMIKLHFFPYQCHFTIAPHSSSCSSYTFSPISVISPLLHIHLHVQATLFPLSVSFHHCSTFIFMFKLHSFPYQCHFTIAPPSSSCSSYTFSPVSVISPFLHLHLHVQATLFPLSVSLHHCSTFIFMFKLHSFSYQCHFTIAPHSSSCPSYTFSPTSVISPLLHIHLHIQATLLKMTSGRSLGETVTL
jgi:hypothetical protein